MTPQELHDWNKKIYGTTPEHLQADWFWSRFRIRSAPLHRDACWSHIPKSWEKPVEIMITEIQRTFGAKVQFSQIKEKFIHLTVYFQAETDEIRDKVNTVIEMTRVELRSRGLHI